MLISELIEQLTDLEKEIGNVPVKCDTPNSPDEYKDIKDVLGVQATDREKRPDNFVVLTIN